MTKLIDSTKEVEIPVIFHNYKLLKDREFVLKGSNIYFIQGPNGVGKTSFLKALTGCLTAKDDTPEKVSRGEEDGYLEMTIPSATGEEITIQHEFTNEKSKFIAIDSHGNKISNVTDIRKLFNYTPINVSEFFAMSKSVEGRRKQRDIILKLLPEKTREEFNQLDLQEQHYYNTRTQVNADYKTANANVMSVAVSDEDINLIEKESEAERLITKYRSVMEVLRQIRTIQDFTEGVPTEIKTLEIRLEEMKKNLQINTDQIAKLTESIKDVATLSPAEIEEKLLKGKSIIQKIADIKAKLNLQTGAKEKEMVLARQAEELTKDIESCRKRKADMISNSELPVNNISFDDGYLSIDGFQFDEAQVCESDAVLILANILAKINPGPIQVIGDASILDNDKLQRLNEIAEANNKIMFVDEVVRSSSEMVIVGYEDIAVDALNKSMELVSKVAKKPKKSNTPNLDAIDAHYEEAKEQFDPTLGKLDDSAGIGSATSDDSEDKPLF